LYDAKTKIGHSLLDNAKKYQTSGLRLSKISKEYFDEYFDEDDEDNGTVVYFRNTKLRFWIAREIIFKVIFVKVLSLPIFLLCHFGILKNNFRWPLRVARVKGFSQVCIFRGVGFCN
jgi:hypothetical protein